MKVKPVAGINRVLDQFLTPQPRVFDLEPQEPARSSPRATTHFRTQTVPSSHPATRVQARRGRPIGRHTGTPFKTEKITLRISRHLAADYRDWSWDARCNLSHLVERALEDYQSRHRAENK